MGKLRTQLCIGKNRLNLSCLGSMKAANLTAYLPEQFRFSSYAIVISLDTTVTSVAAEVADIYQLWVVEGKKAFCCSWFCEGFCGWISPVTHPVR